MPEEDEFDRDYYKLVADQLKREADCINSGGHDWQDVEWHHDAGYGIARCRKCGAEYSYLLE